MPSSSNQVVVTVVHSSHVEIFQRQAGSRVEFESRRLDSTGDGAGQADYEVQVPPGACVVLRSSMGSLQAEGIQGDVILEGTSGAVDVRDIRK